MLGRNHAIDAEQMVADPRQEQHHIHEQKSERSPARGAPRGLGSGIRRTWSHCRSGANIGCDHIAELGCCIHASMICSAGIAAA